MMFGIGMAACVSVSVTFAGAVFARQKDQASQQDTDGNDDGNGCTLLFVQIDFHDVVLWLVGVVRRTDDAIDLGGSTVGFG